MNTIERIRAVVHAGDLDAVAGRANIFLVAARDIDDSAHGYLAASLTPALRELLVDRLASLMEMASKHDFTTWRVELPCFSGAFCYVHMPRDAAEAAWKVWATRDVLACAWDLSKNERTLFEDYERPAESIAREWQDVEELWRIVDCGDILEAQKQRRRVRQTVGERDTLRQKRRVFAEAILDLWLDRHDMETHDDLR